MSGWNWNVGHSADVKELLGLGKTHIYLMTRSRVEDKMEGSPSTLVLNKLSMNQRCPDRGMWRCRGWASHSELDLTPGTTVLHPGILKVQALKRLALWRLQGVRFGLGEHL